MKKRNKLQLDWHFLDVEKEEELNNHRSSTIPNCYDNIVLIYFTDYTFRSYTAMRVSNNQWRVNKGKGSIITNLDYGVNIYWTPIPDVHYFYKWGSNISLQQKPFLYLIKDDTCDVPYVTYGLYNTYYAYNGNMRQIKNTDFFLEIAIDDIDISTIGII
jgi:hypothetical protein